LQPLTNMNCKTLLRPIRLFLVVSVVSTLALTSGCVWAAVGAVVVVFAHGDLEASLDGGVEQAASATNAAVQQLAFFKVSERQDALNDTIVARTASDKRVEIRLEGVSSALTKVKIRVGAFGDEALSRAILDKMKANLKP